MKANIIKIERPTLYKMYDNLKERPAQPCQCLIKRQNALTGCVWFEVADYVKSVDTNKFFWSTYGITGPEDEIISWMILDKNM